MCAIENVLFVQNQMIKLHQILFRKERKIIDEIHDQLLNSLMVQFHCVDMENLLLHKDINYIVKKLSNVSKVEIYQW